MNLHLERMFNLITRILNPAHTSENNLSEEQVNCLVAEVNTEKVNVHNELLFPTLELRTPSEWELHIRQYQCVITFLADLVSKCREENRLPVSGKQYNELLHVLFELLAFIQQHFHPYLNRDENMPVVLQQLKRNLLQKRLQQFATVCNSEINDPPLYAAVIKPITSFLQADIHIAFSYSEIDYLYHYLSALNHLPSHTENPVMELISILVRMNCNSIPLKKYIIQKMKADVQNCSTDQLIRKKLENWQDFLREIPVKSNRGWNIHSISLKEELQVWIEISFLHLQGEQGNQHSTRNKSTSKTNETGFLIMMTVEELALYIRVQKDAGYLRNHNISEMMEELSGIVHTPKQYDVSGQNLYNSYYEYKLATVHSLSEKIFVFNRTLHQLEVKLKNKGSNGKQ